MKNPNAVKDNWQLFLLGYSNETVRKAILFNILTKEQLQARVSEHKNGKITNYIVTEAIDEKTNRFVEFTKTFTVNSR